MAQDSAEGVIFANRGDPLPALNIPLASDDVDDNASLASQEPNQTTKDKWRQRASRIKETFGGVGDRSRDTSSDAGRQSIQDRLLTKLMAQIIPDMPIEEEEDGAEDDAAGSDSTPGKKAKKQAPTVGRPELNPRAMATNFRMFNARIGVVFVFQALLIDLFSWKKPTHTLSLLAVHTLVCLQPHLIPVVPLAVVLFAIMIPNFLARHPVAANDPRIGPSFTGPATAPASRIRPAPEVSRDFWRNMRDLQNSMRDFAVLHDAAAAAITPYVNFGDERVSSTLFVAVAVVAAVALLGTWLVPYQLVALFGGWGFVVLAHPEAQKVLLTTNNLSALQQHLDALQAAFRIWVDADITLDRAPAESRQVEIFELQRHHPHSDTWEAWLFSPTPWEPRGVERVAAAAGLGPTRPRGTQFFEEVTAPRGWVWKEAKWSLDLFAREWVEQRMIVEVEIETEGERWVYDLPPDAPDGGALAPTTSLSPVTPTRTRSGGYFNGTPVRVTPRAGWEEASGLERRGEWRRRRWVRLVERRPGEKKFVESEVANPISVP